MCDDEYVPLELYESQESDSEEVEERNILKNEEVLIENGYMWICLMTMMLQICVKRRGPQCDAKLMLLFNADNLKATRFESGNHTHDKINEGVIKRGIVDETKKLIERYLELGIHHPTKILANLEKDKRQNEDIVVPTKVQLKNYLGAKSRGSNAIVQHFKKETVTIPIAAKEVLIDSKKPKGRPPLAKKALVYQPKDIIMSQATTSTPATSKPTAKPARKRKQTEVTENTDEISNKKPKIGENQVSDLILKAKRGRGRPRKN
ncbi:hypothetical protein BpHYR1_028669 [Brachionus plicatilis]|uniref:Uncharacterized protein n=1 Tax=Brachionus plicatilis TaxID=10195 RepID=A0A3M7T9F1_BRAPC|nr:hypothetical protein BpHYR1_028669 [Brachionus plicatilis]